MRCCIGILAAATFTTSTCLAGDVDDCRAAHGEDLPAYVACLEAALATHENTETQPAAPAVASDPETATPADHRAAGLLIETTPVERSADDELAVQIVETRYTAAGLGIFKTADGQVWRETMASPERRRLKAGQHYTARITRGRLGGYRMHVDGVRWMKTVERLE
jgi:hypothetical protein